VQRKKLLTRRALPANSRSFTSFRMTNCAGEEAVDEACAAGKQQVLHFVQDDKLCREEAVDEACAAGEQPFTSFRMTNYAGKKLLARRAAANRQQVLHFVQVTNYLGMANVCQIQGCELSTISPESI
jgi:hypothetical protein